MQIKYRVYREFAFPLSDVYHNDVSFGLCSDDLKHILIAVGKKHTTTDILLLGTQISPLRHIPSYSLPNYITILYQHFFSLFEYFDNKNIS